jgi:hypothetical protein
MYPKKNTTCENIVIFITREGHGLSYISIAYLSIVQKKLVKEKVFTHEKRCLKFLQFA